MPLKFFLPPPRHSGTSARPRYLFSSSSLRAIAATRNSVLSCQAMDQANILIIGGGVVGCAIAHAVSQKWLDVFLVEQFPKPGMATSSRNSGVIHSGIYYPKGSLKARLCVEGNHLMYEFCAKHNVPHRRTGKLV